MKEKKYEKREKCRNAVVERGLIMVVKIRSYVCICVYVFQLSRQSALNMYMEKVHVVSRQHCIILLR